VAAEQSNVEAAKAKLSMNQARLREAQANYDRAAKDLERFKPLIAKEEISRQQYDAAVAAAESARATVEAAQAAVSDAEVGIEAAEARVRAEQARLAQAEAGIRAAQTAPQQVAQTRARTSTAEAAVQRAQAALAQAELNLEYTTIRAPVSGIVSRRSIETGQSIQAGQPVMAVVPLEQVWVTANFKETQLRNMRPGQPAIIHVDAYGRNYKGHVESIGAATGARFSVLPPENASGNFVKVVQRLPVRIFFEEGQDKQHLLRPGMSVTATVLTK